MQDEITRRLDTSLDMVKDHLHPVLMSHESFAHVQKVAQSLPVFAVDFFGFECRLGSSIGPTDCALNLTPDGADACRQAFNFSAEGIAKRPVGKDTELL